MPSAPNGVETEWVRGPPAAGPLWRRAAKAVYNPGKKSFLGRTAKQWGIVVVFYLVFYSVLALLFAVCMAGLLANLDSTRPTYTLNRSLIGSSPGVTFRPIPLDGLLVKLDLTDPEQYQHYILQLREFLTLHESRSSMDPCSAVHQYGFPETPCIFIKVNKIFDWKPECYDGEINKFPEDMPQELQKHIMELPTAQRSHVWVTCWEEAGNSTEIQFPWGRALSSTVYRNQRGYVSPVLAVRFTPPVDTLVTVRCRAWAKNIEYNRSIKEPSGYARIQLYVSSGAGDNSTETPELSVTTAAD